MASLAAALLFASSLLPFISITPATRERLLNSERDTNG
jgi:hypothetical protein